MKAILWFMTAFFLFLYLFFSSGAWETHKSTRTTQSAATYMDITHTVNWNKFIRYIKNIPQEILNSDVFRYLSGER